MTTKVVRRDDGTGSRSDLLRNLRLHIRCHPHTAQTLARKLGVSTATVDRALRDLRSELEKEKVSLISVREGREWHYEIRMREDVWGKDPLVRAVGTVKGVRPAGESVKEALYGKSRGKR